MNSSKQLDVLKNIGNNESFVEKIKSSNLFPIRSDSLDMLQINIGRICNLTCKHCHVEAGPKRKELMSREILEKCLEIIENPAISTIDITGGSPEMNPHLEWFITEAAKANKKILVRSNGVILMNSMYRKFFDIYARNNATIITSLPDFHEAKTDRQRGNGVYQKLLRSIQMLNQLGYGKDESGLELNLVHNPVGAYLPASQGALEFEFKRRLKNEYNIEFNNLYSLTNIPVGRYLDFLLKTDNYMDYMEELCNAFNPLAVDNVMCKSMISVGWNGILYDCDFNQMLNLPINHGVPNNVQDFDFESLENREIVVDNHCYGCVAGFGSSCQGNIA